MFDRRITTARSWKTPVVYTHVAKSYATHKLRILDFGAGYGQSADLIDAKTLHQYDLGGPRGPRNRKFKREWVASYDGKPYDIVMLSNVLNIQEHCDQVEQLLGDAARMGRLVIFNYPKSPRRLDLKTMDVLDLAVKHGDLVHTSNSETVGVWTLGVGKWRK